MTHIASAASNNMLGVGNPRWFIELKLRNVKEGSWQLEWNDGRFVISPAVQEENEG